MKKEQLRLPKTPETNQKLSGDWSESQNQAEGKRSVSVKRKAWVLLVGILATLFAAILVSELYQIQVVHYDKYALMASQMHWRRIRDIPVRGDILDSNGNVLASTTYEYTVGITPKDVRSIQNKISEDEIATLLSQYLHLDRENVVNALLQKEASYIQLAKKLSKDDIEKLRLFMTEYSLGGIKIDSDPKRYYVYGDLAAQVIGFADQSENTLIGQYGVEAYYNSVLSGMEGYTYVEVDNYSGALPYSPPTTIEKKDGQNIVLNIDMNIQKIAEKACDDAFYAYEPKEGVCAIVMEPYTGAILAMASSPDFDLNNPRGCPQAIHPFIWDSITDEEKMQRLMSGFWRNRVISDTYEPGSTFKVLTTAIALEEGLTYEDEIFSDAPIQVSEMHTISCWREHEGGNHGMETLKQAFERSCNPVFVQLANRIGISKYYQYVRNFGFYDKTGVDLPAEEKGIFHMNPNVIDLASLSFGESSTVTPLQLANVYCALVNGGTLMTPQVAKYLTDTNGNIIKEFAPKPVKTIFSEQTADRVKAMMKTVVTEGTGTAGYVEGYRVAGKTSTSTIDVGDDKGMHVLSFGCYAPYDNPAIVVLVVINKPMDNDLGSSSATKVAAGIVSSTLEYLGVKRILSESDYSKMVLKFELPDVTGMSYKQARQTLYKEGFTAVAGDDNMTDDCEVKSMYPTSDMIIYRNGVVVLYATEPETAQLKMVMVPDFIGKNITECLRLARESGVNINIRGNAAGVVISQNPAFGFMIPGQNEEVVTDSESGGIEENSEASETTVESTFEEGPVAEPERITTQAGTIIQLIME